MDRVGWAGIIVPGASEVSANPYFNSRASVLERLRDYLRLLMKRSVNTSRRLGWNSRRSDRRAAAVAVYTGCRPARFATELTASRKGRRGCQISSRKPGVRILPAEFLWFSPCIYLIKKVVLQVVTVTSYSHGDYIVMYNMSKLSISHRLLNLWYKYIFV